MRNKVRNDSNIVIDMIKTWNNSENDAARVIEVIQAWSMREAIRKHDPKTRAIIECRKADEILGTDGYKSEKKKLIKGKTSMDKEAKKYRMQ